MKSNLIFLAFVVVIIFLIINFARALPSLPPFPAPIKSQKGCCSPKDLNCWPSSSELDAFALNLGNGKISRNLIWKMGTPHPAPYLSPNASQQQPLAGRGVNMSALYLNKQTRDHNTTCFVDGYVSEFCFQSIRNFPRGGWAPSFVVWPTNAEQVQLSVQFAIKHNLCLSFAGSGHDFLNRHSNDHSMFIRTTLMKSITFNPDDQRGPKGTVRVSPGVNFGELYAAADKRRVTVAGGWGATVGVVGWSFGGGHGPLVPKIGLGVDNIVEVDLVSSTGELMTVNETSHRDLFRAVRGGGGSTWGAVASITLKAHPTYQNGLTRLLLVTGPFCTDRKGLAFVRSALQNYTSVGLTLDENWSTLFQINPANSSSSCSSNQQRISVTSELLYQGSNNSDVERVCTFMPLAKVEKIPTLSMERMSDNEPISPAPYNTTNGLPSILVGRDTVNSGELNEVILEDINQRLVDGVPVVYQLYQDITGNKNSPQLATDKISISESFRTSMFHVIVVFDNNERFFHMGEHSYLGESAYEMENWQHRLWGDDVYKRLLEVKKAYDPNNIFWCPSYVGSENGNRRSNPKHL